MSETLRISQVITRELIGTGFEIPTFSRVEGKSRKCLDEFELISDLRNCRSVLSIHHVTGELPAEARVVSLKEYQGFSKDL